MYPGTYLPPRRMMAVSTGGYVIWMWIVTTIFCAIGWPLYLYDWYARRKDGKQSPD